MNRFLVASPAYVEKNGPIESPGDLASHTLISFNNPADQIAMISDSGVVENIPFPSDIKTSHWRPAFEMVRMGMGIGAFEEYACTEALEKGDLVKVLPGFKIVPLDLNLLIQAQRPVPQRVRTIVSILRNVVPNFLPRTS